MEELSEDERKALRGSKFALLPSLSAPSQPRLAHPGGAIKTNKAAALAKFLERKLQDPQGLASLNPDLIERAVKNADAKHSINSGGTSRSGRTIKRVGSFDDPNSIIVGDEEMENDEYKTSKKTKKNNKDKMKKKKKKNKKRKVMDDDTGAALTKKPKKKLTL